MFGMFSPNTFSRVHEASFLLRSLVWVMREQSLVSGPSAVPCRLLLYVTCS